MEEPNETLEIADQTGWTTESECDIEEPNELPLNESEYEEDTEETTESEVEELKIPKGNSKLDCLLLAIVLLLFLVHHLEKDYFLFFVWTVKLELAYHQPPRPLKLAWKIYNLLLMSFAVFFYVLLRVRAKILVRKRWHMKRN